MVNIKKEKLTCCTTSLFSAAARRLASVFAISSIIEPNPPIPGRSVCPRPIVPYVLLLLLLLLLLLSADCFDR